MNIFVGSLPFSVDESSLQEVFEAYGEVASVKIITDKFSGRSKGFGFVEMPDDNDAKKAIEALNGTEMGGRQIVVNKSEEKKERPRGGGGFRGGHSGGDSRGGYNRGGGSGYNRGGGRSGGRGESRHSDY